MGDYLILQWLATRRGFTVFVILVLAAASPNLCSYAERHRTAMPSKHAVTTAHR
jgi:hypothetical protein